MQSSDAISVDNVKQLDQYLRDDDDNALKLLRSDRLPRRRCTVHTEKLAEYSPRAATLPSRIIGAEFDTRSMQIE